MAYESVGALTHLENLNGVTTMTRAAAQAHVLGDPKPLRDSDSQVARATLGLRDMLLRGGLRPGERIAEIPLSAKLGVSRTPLRLAFEKLQHEGLIYALPHSGFAATEFTISDIWDAIETRGILEGSCARLAAERLKDDAQLEPLRRIRRAMEASLARDLENSTEYLDLNEAFHMGIQDLANNKILRRAIEQVYKLPFASPSSRVLLSKTLPGWHEIMPIAEEHHRGILDAIEHGEGSRAENLGREHARLTRRHLELALANKSFIEHIPGAHLFKGRNGDCAEAKS
jgi:GntR family transcriptional regulator of vanillate catabolism